MKISVAENFRAVLYAPFYALRALDFATREGLTVDWLPPRAPGEVFDEVRRGAVDVAWGGPMRVMHDHDVNAHTGTTLRCFGEVVSRDPFCLIAKPKWKPYGLAALPHAPLAIVAEVPTPWLCLQGDLKEAGIAPHGQRVVAGLSMEQQLQALKRGEVEVIQLFEPYVSRALAERAGEVLYAAWQRGPTVYTTFICSNEGIARNADAFRRLTSALARTQEWIATRGAEALTGVVAPFFPDVSTALLSSAIQRYHDAEIWARHPEISRIGFQKLAQLLCLSGYIRSKQSYESCVAAFS